MNYSVLTFGCRVNQADSLALEAELSARGGEAVPGDRADLVIVNTCSVTASADQGARQTIRRIARENPTARIVATGCYATRCADEVAALPGVTAIVRNDDKSPVTFFAKVSRALEAAALAPLAPLAPLALLAPADGACGRPLAPGLMGRTAWTLRVQTGCEEKCSYCIIPTTRGASRSRTFEDINAEVERVIAARYKEIVITGVHLGSYGRDLTPRSSLAKLVASLVGRADALLAGRAEALPFKVLLRISSLEPMDFPLELLDLPVAPHFHLPLQHASNRLLEKMGRPYSIEYYGAMVDTIRDRLPHASIGSDVIVGFPGETDDDFEELARYLDQSPLTHLHVFPYSDRPGTVASTFPDKVHGSVIKARAQRLRDISRQLAERFRAMQRGTTRPALTIEDGSIAVSDNYFRVPAPPGHARNEWVDVAIP
jgi:threonylcarbamoyladenosine tRNA methylthiotransferase MtaB